MWRRQLLRAGAGVAAVPVVRGRATRGDDNTRDRNDTQGENDARDDQDDQADDRDADADVERVFEDTYDEPGLATGVSHSGETVLFGFDDGNVMLVDAERDGSVTRIPIERSVSHVLVRETAGTAVLGWMDADLFGFFDLAIEDGPAIQHPELWDLDATPDATAVASVSQPPGGPGSVALSGDDGEVRWETRFDDAVGETVAIADDAAHVAVGTVRYGQYGEVGGSPGVHLFDGDGEQRWRHDSDKGVLSVGIDADRERVAAGTDAGDVLALDFEGEPLWEVADAGAWPVLADDGATVVSSDVGETVALDAATGEERWRVGTDVWAAEDLSISADGSRALLAVRGEADFALVDDGEVRWSASEDVGPGIGALAGNGQTWTTTVTDLDAEESIVSSYRFA